MMAVTKLPLELISALRSRAEDPHRFIDASEFSGFRSYPRATPEQVKRAEDRVGFPLPEALRNLYMEVANGGFGPGYGILGIDDGASDDLGGTVEQVCEHLSEPDPEAPDWEWPEHALPFCYLGCQVYLCVMPDDSVIELDGYDWSDERLPIVEWLVRWVNGPDHP